MDCVSVWVQSRFYINLVKTYLSSYKKMISFALTLCLTINGFACKLVIVFFIIVIHEKLGFLSYQGCLRGPGNESYLS